MADQGKRLLTVQNVARMLNVSVSTVRRLVREGKLPKPRKLTEGTSRWFPGDVKLYLYRLQRGDFET